MYRSLTIRAELRDAARPPNDENVNAAFRQTTLSPLPQFLVARYAPPCILSVLTVAIMAINPTFAKSVNDYDPDAHIFRSQFTRTHLPRIRSVFSPTSSRSFNGAMGRVFIERHMYFERRLLDCVQTPVTRPLSITQRETAHLVTHAQRNRSASNRPGGPPVGGIATNSNGY